tara:strand:+ start:275 stop:1303 length:1029 start_codon:yes stop_codon:yes gene_type:complete
MKSKFILSRSKVLEQYNVLRDLGVNVSYSWKTNPLVGKILESESDSDFSVHALEEIPDISNKSRIWFFSQAWNVGEIEKLIGFGINSFVVDNEVDLNELIDFIDKHNVKVNLLLRMKFSERRVQSGKYFVYGMDSHKVSEFILKLKDNKNIGKLGIHVHRKSQNTSEWTLQNELEESLSKEVLEIISIINIGGGLPVKYRNYTSDVLNYIFSQIKDLREWLREKNISLVVEPGRFIAGPSVKLSTEIISVYDKNVVVDCSVYQGNTDAIFQDSLKLLVEGELESGEEYLIKGKTPCSLDIFRYKVSLNNPQIGDKIVFLNAGAYNFSTDFCGLGKLETEIVD